MPSTYLPPGFQETRISPIFPSRTVMEFAPDGRIFVGERDGVVDLFKDGMILPTPVLTVPAESTEARGLLGMTLDPHFDQNGYIYVYYTSLVPAHEDRITRFTISPGQDVADPNSEVVILDGIPSGEGWHDGGSMHFGKDGMLYVTTGDGHDRARVQALDALNGKVLRLDTANYPNLIPDDNPFVGTPGARGEIWALGLRNPYTAAIDPLTGRYFVNDVGEAEWEEVNEIVKGGNYGWPAAEGNSSIPGLIDPIYAYAHDGLSSAITGGVFYRGDEYPAAYQNQYYFADYIRGFIRRMDLTTHEVTDFLTSDPWVDGVDPFSVAGAADIDVGPDGNLYYLSLFRGSIWKIEYVGLANRDPVAVAHANTTNGLSPLQVTFDAAGSSDPDGDALTYTWDFGDQSPTATGLNVSHTYTQSGQFQARLTVSDGRGGSTQASSIQITVGNRAPLATILTPSASLMYTAGDTITFTGSGMDPEDGALPASALTWFVLLRHDTHTHPMLGPLIGTANGSVTIGRIGELDDDVSIRIRLIVTDSGGLQHEAVREVFPLKATLSLGSTPAGIPLSLDGQARATPANIVGVIGMMRALDAPFLQVVAGVTYQFVSWSDGSLDAQRQILFPATDTIYRATYRQVDPNDLLQAVAGANVASGPAPLTVTFTAAGSSGPPGAVLNYFWDFGDQSPTQAGLTVTHTYTQPGQYQARLTVSDTAGGFVRASPLQITVNSATPPTNRPPVAVAAANLTSGAVPLHVEFTASGSSDPDGDPLSYTWDFGDETPAASGPDAMHIYTQPGQYQVRLTVRDNRGGATQATAIQITVSAPPNQPPRAIAAADRSSGPAQLLVAFTGSGSSDPDGDPLSYTWDFGDLSPAATGSNVTYTYTQPGQYQARLTVSDGRGGTAQSAALQITVDSPGNRPPAAVAVVDQNGGAAPLQVTFSGAGSSDPDGDTLTYRWDFGDMSPLGSGPSVTHTYGQPGLYLAQLTVSDGRGGTAEAAALLIAVGASSNQPPLAVAAADRTSGPAPFQAAFTAAGSSDPDSDPLSYSWDFGDTSPVATGLEVMHTYAQPGPYQVLLTVNDGRGGVTTAAALPITVEPSLAQLNQPPLALATADRTSGAAPLLVAFTGAGSSDPDGDPLSYAWDFGDQSPLASAADVMYLYAQPGQYQARLTVSDGRGGVTQADVLITVDAAPLSESPGDPQSLASADVTSGAAPLTVTFNVVTDGDPAADTNTYTWSFGDQSLVQTGRTVSHTYTQSGHFQALLIVGDAQGGPQRVFPVEINVHEAMLGAASGCSFAEAFVRGVYADVLGRLPDPEGLSYWVGQLTFGVPAADVAAQIWHSGEHRGIQVDEFYTAFLGRPATAEERGGWTAIFGAGASEADVMQAFLSSPEYSLLYPENGAFVDALYIQVLERSADNVGRDFWIQTLQQGVGRSQVVQEFLRTSEWVLETVRNAYDDFLQRRPDATELGYWSTLLGTSPISLEVVNRAVLASHEYRVQSFLTCSGLTSWDFLVQAAYRDVLGRMADPDSLGFWTAQLDARIPAEQVMTGIWSSGEHRAAQIETYYATFLGREATPEEHSAWEAVFQAGASELDVMQAILSSEEYNLLDLEDGTFVSGLYSRLLQRDADAEGWAFWAQALQQGRSRAEVVHEFLRTIERYTQVIDRYYADFFHRAADGTDRGYWLPQLQSGNLGQEELAGRLLASEEYFIEARDRGL